MTRLNLPVFDFLVREIDGREMIFDDLRQSYVRLTPEESVRQHFVRYMIHECGYPRGLLAIEYAFTYQLMPRRADVVVFSRKGAPLLMVECKAPSLPVSQKTFDQVARYNKVIGVDYLAVTNGMEHYCCRLERESNSCHFLDGFPIFDDLPVD